MVTTAKIEETAPHRFKMSYAEYLEMAGETKIVEWVEGEVIIHMPPLYQHQSIISFLDRLLGLFVEFFDLGVLIPAPFEVKLWPEGPSREPDLIFISHENLSHLTVERFEGGPDLVIEVISPTSVAQDRVHKFTQYEQAGVREYWIIDPRPYQQHVDFYVLDQDQKHQPMSVGEDGIYHSTVIPNFWFKLDWFWQKKLPNPQLALAEIMISIEELPLEVRNTYQAIYNLLSAKH